MTLMFILKKRAGEGMGGLGGRETPLAPAEGFPFPPDNLPIVLTGPGQENKQRGSAVPGKQKRKRREPQPAQNAAGTRPVIDADERKGYFPCAFAGRSDIFLLFSRAVSRKHVPPAACRHPLYFCFCLEVSWLNPIPVPPLAGTPLIQCGCSISSARP